MNDKPTFDDIMKIKGGASPRPPDALVRIDGLPGLHTQETEARVRAGAKVEVVEGVVKVIEAVVDIVAPAPVAKVIDLVLDTGAKVLERALDNSGRAEQAAKAEDEKVEQRLDDNGVGNP